MPTATRKTPYAFLPTLPRQGRGGTVQRVQDVVREAIVRLELPPGTAIHKAAPSARAAGAPRPDSRPRFPQPDRGLHELLRDFLGYDRVKHAVEAARGSLDRARLFMCTPQRQLSTFGEHRAIVAALKKRNPDAALHAMEAHLDAVMTELLDFAERNPDAVALPARDP